MDQVIYTLRSMNIEKIDENVNVPMQSGPHLIRKSQVLQDHGCLSDVDLRSLGVFPAPHHQQLSDGGTETVLESRSASPEAVGEQLQLGNAEQ